LERYEERRKEFESAGARIAGLSVDPVDESQELANNHKLGFPIISDTSGDTVKAYGVWHADKKISLPAVFVIDRAGVIRWRYVSKSVGDRPEEDDVLAEVKKLR